MPELIEAPTPIRAAGEPPKLLEELVGRATGEHRFSIAHVHNPAGWPSRDGTLRSTSALATWGRQ